MMPTTPFWVWSKDATKKALMDGLKEAYKNVYSTPHPLTTIKGEKLVEWDKAACSLAAQIPKGTCLDQFLVESTTTESLHFSDRSILSTFKIPGISMAVAVQRDIYIAFHRISLLVHARGKQENPSRSVLPASVLSQYLTERRVNRNWLYLYLLCELQL
jgi:hypothetical protein